MVSDFHSRTSDKCHDGANVCSLFTEPLVSTCKTHLYMIRTNDKIWLIVSFKLAWWVSLLTQLLRAAGAADYLTPDALTRQRFEPGVSGKRTTFKPLIISELIFLCEDALFWIWLIYWRGNLPVKMLSLFLLIYIHRCFSRKLLFYLFIIYFLGLLDLIDFGNEKPFIPYDTFHFSLLCPHWRWAVDSGQKLDFQALNTLVVGNLIVREEKKNKTLNYHEIRNTNFWHWNSQLLSQQIQEVWSQNLISMTQHGLKPLLKALFGRESSRAEFKCAGGESQTSKHFFLLNIKE